MALSKTIFVDEETLITAAFLNALQDEVIRTQTEVASKSTIFKITITENEDGSYTANKTFAEVKAAIELGAELVAVWNSNEKDTYHVPLCCVTETYVIFSLCVVGDLLGTQNCWTHLFRLANDDSLTVVERDYSFLPDVTESDNGKMLTVVGGAWAAAEQTTEEWTFTLEDGSTVTKAVYVG